MTLETEIMIAGAGPIGLTLGLELSSHGVPCFIAERNRTTTRHPKMDVTNGRSMELFRRLGVAGRQRAAAVPEDHNMDVSWITGMSGYEIYRFRYPTVVEARELIRRNNDGNQPLEPNMRISQVVLEPVLRDILYDRPTVTLRYGRALEPFDQDDDGVTSTIRHGESGGVETVRSRFLVGCDGAGSVVRRGLGIGLEGITGTRPRYMVHFRSTQRDVLQRWGIAWHYQSPVHGVMICQDDDEIWTLQAVIPDGVDPAEADPRDLLTRFLGTEIDCEILQSNYWVAHLLLADSYGAGRVFLAGDSAHQYIPTGGYGMNTGVGDAVDLGWKLAAVLDGWGTPGLLRSYEQERRPIGLSNREASRFHAETKATIFDLWSPRLAEAGPAGDIARSQTAERIRDIGNAENESLGIELGYRYDDSPVICQGDGALPRPEFVTYTASSRPGGRAPSVYLEDGRAVFDLLGPGFTLLDFKGSATAEFAEAAERCGMPLDVLRIDDANARRIYQRDLVLVRPDQHVAWRGDAPPDDPASIVGRVRGAAPAAREGA